MTAALRVRTQAAPLLTPLAQTTSAKAQEQIAKALSMAAALDGDRVVDVPEAQLVRAAYDKVNPQALDDAAAKQIRALVEARVAEAADARPTGTEVMFTSEGTAEKRFRAAIVGAIEDALAKAQGAPVSVDILMFAFTHKDLADDLLRLARSNSNLTLCLIADWSQLPKAGSRQPPRLAHVAHQERLKNVQIKFKKDNPYTWDANRQGPAYSHTQTEGLNHHKGMLVSIAGEPQTLVTGSFNWSSGAMTQYENLMVLKRTDPDNRKVLDSYLQEFAAFWNNGKVALDWFSARREKDRLYKDLHTQAGVAYSSSTITDTVVHPDRDGTPKARSIDVNALSDDMVTALAALTDAATANAIHAELRDYGRLDDWDELVERVPAVLALSTQVLAALKAVAEFGETALSINEASAGELVRAGLTAVQAQAVVDFRDQHGAFESLAELVAVAGMDGATIEKLSLVARDQQHVATYSARVPGEAATTGYAATNRGTFSVPKDPNDGQMQGVVPANRATQEQLENDMASVVADLLRRAKPGDTFRLAIYGISSTSPEYQELIAALNRGVAVRAMIYDAYNEKVIEALRSLRDGGMDVDVRVIHSKVMHEKFGVIGDDVFNGSANWSKSSITKHSEDRFLFRNVPRLAARFVAEFERLWSKGDA